MEWRLINAMTIRTIWFSAVSFSSCTEFYLYTEYYERETRKESEYIFLEILTIFLLKESILFVVIAIYFSDSIFSLTRVTESVNWGRFSSCTPLM